MRLSNAHLDVNVTNEPVETSEDVPGADDILGASRATTGTLITVPAGRVFKGSMELSCSISVAGSNVPTISISGSGAAPSGEVLRVEASGLALSTVTNSASLALVYIHGGDGGATVTFTAGASGLSSGSIAGRLL